MLGGENQFLKAARTDIDGTEDASDICIAVFENISIKNEKIFQIMIKPRTLKLEKTLVCINSSLRLKKSKGAFVKLKNSSRNVIPGIRYIRNSLYPICVKSGLGCVIIEGYSIALFTAQM